jgi:zinc transport system substrate-binding protein
MSTNLASVAPPGNRLYRRLATGTRRASPDGFRAIGPRLNSSYPTPASRPERKNKLPACALLLFFLTSITLAAAPASKPFTILCSFYPMYVMALNVVGDEPGVKVECLTEPFVGCLHDYQLTPANLKTIATADVFIANGAGMESFLDKALRQSSKLRTIEASRGVKLLDENPHVWVSITGEIQETQNIARELAAADPAHAAAYARNAADYVNRLEALRAKMHVTLDGLTNRNIVTFHEAFPYFAREFDLKIVAVVEREPGSEPNAGELARTIQQVRKEHVKAIFAEPQYPAKSAEVIHRETGVPVSILDPAVTGPREPAAARDSYIHTMEENLKVLVKALKD